MAITYAQKPLLLSQDEFHAVDYQVMGQAFALHNEMGNLWDEQEYRRQLDHELLWINFDKNNIELSCLHDSA